MDEDILIMCAAAVACIGAIKFMKKKRQRRSMWVNPLLKERESKGRFETTFGDMIAFPPMFKENFHMSAESFDYIFGKVEGILESKKNCRPDKIPAKQKLSMVVEYLASGDLQRHIASNYRVGKQTFGEAIDEVCDAICVALKDQYKSFSETEWLEAANQYNAKWNMPNCLGAIDGKHVAIRCPKNAGSLFYNYKGFHSIVMMAIADADYRFMHVDIGAYGSEGDSSIFNGSRLGDRIIRNTLPLPADTTIGSTQIPFFFVADDAFPLCTRIMKPYCPGKGKTLTEEERIFNYRLSRARRCVENSFGILTGKWLCLSRTMFCGPDRAQKIISTCCILHNYLLINSRETYCPKVYADYYNEKGDLIEGAWRKNVTQPFSPLQNTRRGRLTDEAKNIRDHLRDYVNSEHGALEWQRKAIFVT